jgi:hypothetical protein
MSARRQSRTTSGSHPHPLQRHSSRRKHCTRNRSWCASYPRSILLPRRSSHDRCESFRTELECVSHRELPAAATAEQPGSMHPHFGRIGMT